MENSFQRKLDLKLILSVIAAGLMSFTGVVVATAMNVTFPTLMKQFGIGTATVQWITTGYLLMLSVIIPLSSFLKKRFPMKHLFLFAVSVFIIATVMCMLAPTFTVLLLGRLLQGVGAGIALPLMFNIVLEQTPFDKMGFMMGIASLIAAIAPAVGPSFGGLIVNTLGWRMIFAFLLPLLVISLVLGIYAIRQSSATEHVSFDVPGYLLIIIGFFCFIYGINSASKVGWISIRVAVLFLICLAALLLFVHHTKYLEKPLIDLKIFGISKFTFSVLFLILLQFICLGIGFLLPNYSQLVMGENALTAGCILLPGCIIGAVLNPFTGKLLDHCGASLPIFIGTGCALISSLLFAGFITIASTTALSVIYIFFAIAQGFTVGNIMTNGLGSLSPQLKADGNAVFSTFQQLAGAMGTSVVSTIVAAAQGAQPANMVTATALGTRNSFILLLILTLVMAFCAYKAVHVKKVSLKTHCPSSATN
jgi:DHA2 family lincomycin resistance protein-like MFS transporter